MVKTLTPALPLFDNLRLKAGVAVTRNGELSVAVFARDGLFRRSISPIAALIFGLFVAFFLAEMRRHLRRSSLVRSFPTSLTSAFLIIGSLNLLSAPLVCAVKTGWG